MIGRLLTALFGCLLAGPLQSAELHNDVAFDTRIGLSRKWDVVLHNRARVVTARNEWYDISAVPTFRYQAHPRAQLFGGAFVTRTDFADGAAPVVRPFAGVEPVLIEADSLTVSSRTGYERFIAFERHPDFNRYRQRFRIRGDSKWTPYANVEFFFLNDGLDTTRYGVGFRRDLSERNGIEIGYWYEASDLTGRGIRHMITTTFHLNFKGLAPDL